MIKAANTGSLYLDKYVLLYFTWSLHWKKFIYSWSAQSLSKYSYRCSQDISPREFLWPSIIFTTWVPFSDWSSPLCVCISFCWTCAFVDYLCNSSLKRPLPDSFVLFTVGTLFIVTLDEVFLLLFLGAISHPSGPHIIFCYLQQ